MEFIKPEPVQYPLPLNQVASRFVDIIDDLMSKNGDKLSGIVILGIRDKKEGDEQLEKGWSIMVSNLPEKQMVYFTRNYIEDFEQKLEKGKKLEDKL